MKGVGHAHASFPGSVLLSFHTQGLQPVVLAVRPRSGAPASLRLLPGHPFQVPMYSELQPCCFTDSL